MDDLSTKWKNFCEKLFFKQRILKEQVLKHKSILTVDLLHNIWLKKIWKFSRNLNDKKYNIQNCETFTHNFV